MPENQLATAQILRAIQIPGQVAIFAAGEKPSPGYGVTLEPNALQVFPPEHLLVLVPPDGIDIPVMTPFLAETSFEAEEIVDEVVVYDSRGGHRITVEHAFDWIAMGQGGGFAAAGGPAANVGAGSQRALIIAGLIAILREQGVTSPNVGPASVYANFPIGFNNQKMNAHCQRARGRFNCPGLADQPTSLTVGGMADKVIAAGGRA